MKLLVNMRVFVIVLMLLNVIHCANILAFFYFPSKSHQYVFKAIVRELSLRGHQVTFVTPNPENDSRYTNITEIDISVGYDVFRSLLEKHAKSDEGSSSTHGMMIGANQLYQQIITRQFDTAGVKKILSKPEDSYDLLLIESLTPALYGIQHKFKAPLIAVSSFGAFSHLHHSMGNPTHPILYPDIFAYTPEPITQISNKIASFYIVLLDYFIDHFYVLPSFDKLMRTHFGEDMPYIEDMIKNTSLLFLNVNPLFSDRRPLVPNVKEFHSIHLKRNDILPQDLQNILDSANNGVVFFSLGTNIRLDNFRKTLPKIFMEVFANLPYTVLCKWESDEYPGKPKNVIIRKWLPQQSVLAHPNVKVFVMQGGLQSVEEAISNAVPMVVIPFWGDQPMNAKKLANYGVAETLSPLTLNKNNLEEAILNVANHEKYRLKAEELRDIFQDQSQSSLDNIVWWCEYVIRHKGAQHLRSPAADISLYEYFMLDVFAVIFVSLLAAYKTLRVVLRFLGGILVGERTRGKSKNKTQ